MTAPSAELIQNMVAAWNAGDAERVLALAAQASDAEAGNDGFLALLGAARQQAGRYEEAARAFARLAGMQPGVSAWWNNLGVARRHAGDLAGAEHALLRAKALAPNDADVDFNLGLVYVQARRWSAAREALLEAVRRLPHWVEARLEAAHACHVCGDIEGEEAMLEGVDGWPPRPAPQALVLASVLSVLGRLDVALKVLAQAILPAGPVAAPLRLRISAQRVALYERNNRLEEARDELAGLPLDAIDALPAGETDARVDAWRAHAVMALRAGRHAEAAALYERVLDLAADDETRAAAAFGLAAARDREGRYDAAWSALDAAHAAQMNVARQAAPKLSAAQGEPLPMVTRTVSAAEYAAWTPLAPLPDADHPVFVIGFPRSGTTLLEQMLDAHPGFCSMDERGFVYQLIERMEGVGQRYPADLASLTQGDVDQLRAVYFRLVEGVLPGRGARRLVDKNPLNMMCLPMILRLFPDARIILCVRHPCDVLLSCCMQSFRSPVFMAMCASLGRLARGYAGAFEQCCGHLAVFKPRALEWRYEAVVADFDAQADRLARFLGVADAAPMKAFAAHARAKRFIATPSYAQVTQPVTRAAVGRWEHYREHFEPVLPVLHPWLRRFGYEA